MSVFHDLRLPTSTNGHKPPLWFVKAKGDAKYLLRDSQELVATWQANDIGDFYFVSEADAIKAALMYYRRNRVDVPQEFMDAWDANVTWDPNNRIDGGTVEEAVESTVMEFI